MREYLAILLADFLAAASSVLVRYVYGMDMFLITLFVLFFASLFFLVVSILKKEEIKLNDIRTLAIFGATQLGTWLFLYGAIILNPISVSMFLFYMSPIFVIVASPMLLGERVHPMSMACIAIALIGMLMVFNPLAPETLSATGIVFALLAAASYALNLIIGRKLKSEYGPFTLSFLCHFFGFLLLLPLIPMFSDLGGITAGNLYTLSLMGVLSGAGYGLLYLALRTFLAQKAAIINLTEPISATLLGVLLFNEVPTPFTLAGGALILIGAGLTYRIES